MRRFTLTDAIDQYRKLSKDTTNDSPDISAYANQIHEWLCELRRYRRGVQDVKEGDIKIVKDYFKEIIDFETLSAREVGNIQQYNKAICERLRK